MGLDPPEASPQEVMSPMAHRKHTRCAVCSRVGRYWYCEVQYRRSCDVVWSWSGGWMCASCWSCIRAAVEEMRPSLLAIDG